ncbi:MAG: arginine--tRNA ligase [Candidatus Diapherotrites archaeon]|nr:arginine--tRNA ligase [Candidatus Diapherotrites archaeon]
MLDLKKGIAKAFSGATGITEEQAFSLIESPPERKFGDFSIPVFTLCKKGENPAKKAKEISEKIKKTEGISKIGVLGPYINFFLDESALSSSVIESVLSLKENFGKNSEGKGKNVMVEYSAPNTNKPLHIGHLRNDCIGMAVSNLFEAAGYKVIRANLVNDRGIHICQAMVAYKKFGEGKDPKKAGMKGDKFVGEFYVKFNRNAKENPQLQEEANELLRKWEAKDPETIALWKKMREWVFEGFKETYKKFGSSFDEIFFESDFYDKAKPLIELGLKKGVFEKTEEGAVIARLEKYGFPDKTVLRADGTSIYISNDLALTKHKVEAFHLDKNLYCVASEQDLYFRQLFKVMELLGFPWAKKCEHLSYGLVFLPEGKMKSREGKVIDADDLIAQIERLALAEIEKRYPALSGIEKSKRAEAIALAAIKFAMLRIDHKKDFTFVPEQSVSFEGESGPYIQYTYARAKSVLRKAGWKGIGKEKIDFSALADEKEKGILKSLSSFPETVQKTLEGRNPNILCHFLLSLSEQFNTYYHDSRIIGSEEEKARLALAEAVSIVLKSGLSLLNIPVLEEM